MNKKYKNKKEGKFFVFICLLICIIPFIGMAVIPTKTTTENKVLATFPKIKEGKKWNSNWLSEAGLYFEDHFAFRPYLVTVDSEIQSRIFGVSNMDTVIDGKNGWLYYSATLDDYLGKNTMSERAIYNIAHNISLIQQYIEEKGAAFLFTVAPNKNSLYGDFMPYYDNKKISKIKNMIMLEPYLKKFDISYVDLFSLFEQEKEILYLKRDSHWNQKGAVLVYNALLNSLEIEHETYETVKSVRTMTEYGDLNLMLYPKSAVPEWNYTYEKENNYQYITETKSVEDAWIETRNEKGKENLLMFRDSFGNTLLPLMADVFQKGYFSKSTPYHIEEYMNQYYPNIVIIEKVERNLCDFAKEPPIMSGIQITIGKIAEERESKTTITMSESDYDMNYWKIEGTLDSAYGNTDTKIYIGIQNGEEVKTYEPFTTSEKKSDYGYILYLPKTELTENEVQMSVIAETKGNLVKVKQETWERKEEGYEIK